MQNSFIEKLSKIDVPMNEETGMFSHFLFFKKIKSIQFLKLLHNKTFIYEKACSLFILNFLSYNVVVLVFSIVDK